MAVFFLYMKASDELYKRKKFENAFRRSEYRYRSIYHNTPAMLHSIDTEGRLISVSDNWLEVLGYDRDEVIGQKLTRFFTAASRRLAEGTVIPQFFKTGICKDIPYQFVKKNDDTIDILLSAIGDRDDKGNVVRSLAVSIDVTERNRAEKALKLAKEELDRYSKDLEDQVEVRTKEITSILNQLRRLSGNIMANQEKERSAIARELHDELGQILTALRMDSVWLWDRLEQTDPKASQRALTMCSLIDKTIEGVRGMAIRLRPGVLDDLGLVDALEWYTSDFEKRTGITCLFEHHNVPDIDDTVATAAYRITQEALTTVARHANASRVEVTLLGKDSTLTLATADDGKGFNTLDLTETEALGLAGMRERAGLVGGELEVQSQPEKGTRVKFKVPIDSI
jgi:PAS domain S-box-containing protein